MNGTVIESIEVARMVALLVGASKARKVEFPRFPGLTVRVEETRISRHGKPRWYL